MDAHELGAGDGGGHGGSGLADTPEGLLLGVGEDGAQPAGGAVAGEEPSDFGQVLRRGGVHVHAVAAVGVEVQEAGDQQPAPQVHGLIGPAAEPGDAAVLHQQVGVLKAAVHVDPAVGKAGSLHGGPQKGCPAARALVKMMASGWFWRRLAGKWAVTSP